MAAIDKEEGIKNGYFIDEKQRTQVETLFQNEAWKLFQSDHENAAKTFACHINQQLDQDATFPDRLRAEEPSNPNKPWNCQARQFSVVTKGAEDKSDARSIKGFVTIRPGPC